MTDSQQIANGLNEVFSHRQSFIVVALTGRTGSGCSTVAKLLSSKTHNEVPFPDIPVPPKNHEDRKDRIIHNWLKQHWHPFQSIQVSQIILLLALSESYEDFSSFIKPLAKKNDLSEFWKDALGDYEAHSRTCKTLKTLRSADNADVFRAYEHIFHRLPMLSDLIKNCLTNSHENAYTPLFQKLGDNVRRSGRALSDSTTPDQLLVLPETICRIIKLARLYNRLKGIKRNYFCIDALRHPFEIRYLSERISPFYAVAVSTDELSRKSRLQSANLRAKEIEELDAKEYPSEHQTKKINPLSGYSSFISQNIQACLEIANIYIRNIGAPEQTDFKELGRQVCRYIALMQHPGIVTPTSVERCMHVAFSVKLNSGCISRQVGAVVTDEKYSIKGVGWNDVPSGQVPCLLRNTAHVLSGEYDSFAYSDFEKKNKDFRNHLKKMKKGVLSDVVGGRNNTYCFKTVYNDLKDDRNQVHTRSLHAEENAFLQISKHGGQGLEGGCLFTTASPCELCAKKARQIGIKEIYYIDPYPGISIDHVLLIGKNTPDVILFSGSIGRAYHELYEPIMPYKDELARIVIPSIDEKEQEDLEIE